MRSAGGCKWGLAVLLVLALVATGCAKKEVVRSNEEAGKPAAEAAAPSAKPETIVSEPVKPEVPKAQETPSSMAGTQTAAAEAAAGVAATEEKASMFQDIYFDFDKSFIREDAKPALAKVADYLKKNAGAKVQVEGHCDERGTAEYNMALGARRAEAAKKYLLSLGVKGGALSTVSYGKEKPLDPAHTEDAWAKNRRDHFVLK